MVRGSNITEYPMVKNNLMGRFNLLQWLNTTSLANNRVAAKILRFSTINIFRFLSFYIIDTQFILCIIDSSALCFLYKLFFIQSMSQEDEVQFPEFLSTIKQPEKEKLIESPPKQKSQSRKKRQLIQKITKKKQQDKKQSAETDEFTCFVCQQYFVKPVTAKCGHSFCDYCLQEYFLYSKNCPICEKNIRGFPFTYNNALNEFIDGFIRTHHRDYVQIYEQRVEKYKVWKNEDKPLKQDFRAGLIVDVRDENYVWCKGVILRVISKVGEPIKFLKIQYKTQNNQTKQQQIRWTSERVAPVGFYTERKQIPKYRQQLNQLNKDK